MNRPLAIMLSLMFLWTGAAGGFAAPCCCKTDTSGLMDGSNDGCGSDAEAFFCQGHLCGHDGPRGCSSFGCPKESIIASLSEFKPLLPKDQISALPITVVDREKGFQARRPLPDQIRSSQEKPIELLLRTSSFLF